MKNKITLAILILSMITLIFSGCDGGNLVTPSIPVTPNLITPTMILSPVVGDLEIVNSDEQCLNTKWCFNQHKICSTEGIGHCPGGGLCQADDTYAWDANLNIPFHDSDNGKPVYAVEEGTVSQTYGGCTNAGGSYGQLLIEHTYKGNSWWSGYLHLKDIQVVCGQNVDQNTLLGYISNISSETIPNHLHFVVYKGQNSKAGLISFDAEITPRDFLQPSLTGKIAFTSKRDGNEEIYIMNADGSNQTNITNNRDGDYDPCFSPDGTKIAFISCGTYCNIYVMNADGSGKTRLTNTPFWKNNPCFSPDGTKIAFGSSQGISVMNTDGSNQTNITTTSFWDEYPCFSPDGTKIAFMSMRDGPGDIYIMNADGTNITRLTNNGGYDPCFSPDGTKIVFTSYEGFSIMNTDGSNQTNITTTSFWDEYPCFSPDGTKIAFASNCDGNYEIYVMNADGSGRTRLTNNSASDSRPSWGP